MKPKLDSAFKDLEAGFGFGFLTFEKFDFGFMTFLNLLEALVIIAIKVVLPGKKSWWGKMRKVPPLPRTLFHACFLELTSLPTVLES